MIRKEGILTQVKIQLLFKIREFWEETGFPPKVNDLRSLGGKTYAGPTITYHLGDLIRWGYVHARELKNGKHDSWKLTEKGIELIGAEEIYITIEGEGKKR